MQCDKITYQTKKEADGDLKGLRERHGRHKYALYKCPTCGKFHIHTITKRVLRPNKKDKYPIQVEYQPIKKQNKKRKK